MKGIIGMVLLIIGVCLAGTYGARNGETHTAYRADKWEATNIEGREPSVGLPQASQRMREWFASNGVGFSLGVLLILLGAGLSRKQKADDNRGTGASKGSSGVDFSGSVNHVVEVLEGLQERIADLPFNDDAPQARETIDTLFSEHIGPIVDARGKFIARHGIGRFAEYFGPFSAGERKLNRVWSGLTDGHPEVARAALKDSLTAFRKSLELYAVSDSS